MERIFDTEWKLSDDGMSVIIDDRIEVVLTGDSYKSYTSEEREYLMNAIALLPDMYALVTSLAATAGDRLTAEDLGEMFGVHAVTIRSWVSQGKIPPPRVARGRGRGGKVYYWDAEEVIGDGKEGDD